MEILTLTITLTILAVVGAIAAFRYRQWLLGNLTPLLLSVATIVSVLAFLVLFYSTPGTDIGIEQPIPFSHRVHAGVKNIQCRYCHPYVDYSNHPGIPPVEKCLHCHNYIIANHPWIKEEHRYYNTQTPTPWRKANYLAEHVLFNHQRHIRRNLACKECHGQVEQMDRIRGKYFYMEFCIQCHRERNANLGCWLACHS